MENWWKEISFHVGNVMQTFKRKLKELKIRLKSWNKEKIVNFFIEKKKKMEDRMMEV